MGRHGNMVAATSAAADGYYGGGSGAGASGHHGGDGGQHHHHHHGHHHHNHGNGNGHNHHHHHHHHATVTGGPVASAAVQVDVQGMVGGSGGSAAGGYRVQRQTANIRERRRMLRSDLAPTRTTDRPTPVKM